MPIHIAHRHGQNGVQKLASASLSVSGVEGLATGGSEYIGGVLVCWTDATNRSSGSAEDGTGDDGRSCRSISTNVCSRLAGELPLGSPLLTDDRCRSGVDSGSGSDERSGVFAIGSCLSLRASSSLLVLAASVRHAFGGTYSVATTTAGRLAPDVLRRDVTACWLPPEQVRFAGKANGSTDEIREGAR